MHARASRPSGDVSPASRAGDVLPRRHGRPRRPDGVDRRRPRSSPSRSAPRAAARRRGTSRGCRTRRCGCELWSASGVLGRRSPQHDLAGRTGPGQQVGHRVAARHRRAVAVGRGVADAVARHRTGRPSVGSTARGGPRPRARTRCSTERRRSAPAAGPARRARAAPDRRGPARSRCRPLGRPARRRQHHDGGRRRPDPAAGLALIAALGERGEVLAQAVELEGERAGVGVVGQQQLAQRLELQVAAVAAPVGDKALRTR